MRSGPLSGPLVSRQTVLSADVMLEDVVPVHGASRYGATGRARSSMRIPVYETVLRATRCILAPDFRLACVVNKRDASQCIPALGSNVLHGFVEGPGPVCGSANQNVCWGYAINLLVHDLCNVPHKRAPLVSLEASI